MQQLRKEVFYRQLNLRGHHLLCIFGWRGYGHSENFNRAMDEVVGNLQRHDIVIETKDAPDQLCNTCPYLSSSGCFKDERDQEEEIQAHDKRVLDFLGLAAGDEVNVKQLKSLIQQKKPYEKLPSLCEGCPWLEKDYCYEGLKGN